jgi:drug/metabolite transporter (DMT)-like permease
MSVYGVNALRNRLLHGFYWSRKISIFFNEEDDSIDWINVLGVCLMSFCKFCGFCLVVQTFQYANAAGMNLGIITVIFNFCCITDSVVFYFVFNEKLSKSQLIGSGVLLMSAIFIAQKPASSDKVLSHYGRYPNESDRDFFERVQKTEKDHYYNAMLAITFALCSTLFFSARDVILRFYKVNKQYPAFELSLDSLTIYSFGCVLYSIYIFGFKGYEFDWGSYSAGCMSAVLNTMGFMMLGISVVIGYAGPANALNSIQAVVLTFLSVMLMNQIPSPN